jgi:hypothetical protein
MWHFIRLIHLLLIDFNVNIQKSRNREALCYFGLQRNTEVFNAELRTYIVSKLILDFIKFYIPYKHIS